MKHAASFLRAAVLVALGGAVGTASADITVISFGGASQKAQDKAYYAPFTKATGVKVVAGEYNGEQAKVKAMVEAGNVTWDVLEVESPELVRGCEEGLFEKIDFAQVGDKADFVPAAVSECGVGIFVWSTALAYNADRLKEAPTSWADFWNVDKFPGKRGLRKGAKYTLEFALLADGVRHHHVDGVRGRAGAAVIVRKGVGDDVVAMFGLCGVELVAGHTVARPCAPCRAAPCQGKGRALAVDGVQFRRDVQIYGRSHHLDGDHRIEVATRRVCLQGCHAGDRMDADALNGGVEREGRITVAGGGHRHIERV